MQNKEPLVSIAVCTYNGAKYIKEQLFSIISQTYQNLEIIIIDDCSTDQTLSILEGFRLQDSRIQLFQNDKNLGFNTNFNKAISLTKGKHIAIADQDDIWDVNKISLMCEKIADNLLLYHNSSYIKENGNLTKLSISSHHRFVAGNCAINFLYYNCVSGHTCLIHRDLLQLTPPCPKDFYYDWWFAYTAACLSSIDFLNNSLVKHRKHAISATSKDLSEPKLLRLQQFKLFLKHPQTPKKVKNILQKLILHYEELKYKQFSPKLFVFLIKNSCDLFYIRRKSTFGKLKFILRESSK